MCNFRFFGRYYDGWWAGIKVIAPDTLNMETAKYTSGGAEKLFKTYKDSADGDETQYITMWGYINEEFMRTANLTDGIARYTYTFDWDGDGVFEQTVNLDFDATQATLLNESGVTVYPAPTIGYGRLEMLTGGATITSNESESISISYNDELAIDWVAADPSIGRYQDGWWAGMKITVPDGMTVEQVKNAQYMSGENVRSFWSYKDSKDDAAVHYMTMWVPLNNLLSNSMKPFTYKFDWNNDGIFEQTVVMTVDDTKVTLTKDGAQVYPVLGQVSSYNGGAVTGSGTGIVNVLINDVSLNWSAEDASIGRTQGWWAGIRVEAPAGLDSATLRNAKLQVRRSESDLWENAEVLSFWDYKDSADDASVHHVGLWLPVSPSIVAEYAAAGKNITRWYRFDWDNDGTYEQEVTFSVDPSANQKAMLDPSYTGLGATQGKVDEVKAALNAWLQNQSGDDPVALEVKTIAVNYLLENGGQQIQDIFNTLDAQSKPGALTTVLETKLQEIQGVIQVKVDGVLNQAGSKLNEMRTNLTNKLKDAASEGAEKLKETLSNLFPVHVHHDLQYCYCL